MTKIYLLHFTGENPLGTRSRAINRLTMVFFESGLVDFDIFSRTDASRCPTRTADHSKDCKLAAGIEYGTCFMLGRMSSLLNRRKRWSMKKMKTKSA